MRLKKGLILLVCMVCFSTICHGQAGKSAFDVEGFVKRFDEQKEWVYDDAKIFSAEGMLQKKFQTFFERTGIRVTLLSIDSFFGQNPEQLVSNIEQRLNAHMTEVGYGVLILLSKDKQVAVATGSEIKQVFLDKYVSNIVRNTMLPNVKKGKFDDAVRQFFVIFSGVFSGYFEHESSSNNASTFISITFFFMIVFMLYMIFRKGGADRGSLVKQDGGSQGVTIVPPVDRADWSDFTSGTGVFEGGRDGDGGGGAFSGF